MSQTKAKKILVVDDDPVLIRMLESFLTDKGFEVSVARDGLDAMVQVRKSKPELIVLDIMMPELNGYEVCSYLKFNEDFKKIPIIILTARDRELDERIGKMMGIEYVHKPFNPEQLLSLINELSP